MQEPPENYLTESILIVSDALLPYQITWWRSKERAPKVKPQTPE